MTFLPSASRAAVGQNADGSYYADSADLTVTIFPLTGKLRVFDKVSGMTWNQTTNLSHTAFLGVPVLRTSSPMA